MNLVETVRSYRASDLGTRIRLGYRGAEYRGRARTTNWDGSLNISDNAILRANVINNWNLDRGIQLQGRAALIWKAVTTGNFGAIDLWLEENAGRIAFTTKPISAEVAIADIGLDEMVFDAGGLERAATLQRLPNVMTERSVIHHRQIKRSVEKEMRLYVRVQQEDGHRAWSSPIYLLFN